MQHAAGTLFLSGGFVACLLLAAVLPFLRVSRKKTKLLALGLPLIVLLLLTAGSQGTTGNYWIATIPGIACLLTIGADAFWGLRQKQKNDLIFTALTATASAWSFYASVLALNPGFMGASC